MLIEMRVWSGFTGTIAEQWLLGAMEGGSRWSSVRANKKSEDGIVRKQSF
jgi:hypothetical protein